MDKDLLEKIKKAYKLPEIISSKKIDKGFLSENYKISTERVDYFLKKYRFKDQERIREIHTVKAYFSRNGIPVIMPIKLIDGETFFEYEGSVFALFPFVSGLQPERGELSEKMIISLGQMLGRMHVLGKNNPIKIDDVFSGWDKTEALHTAEEIEEKINQIDNKSDFDKLAEKVVILKKDLIQKNGISFSELNLKNDHLIHGDYLDQNVFFDDEGEIKYVFDFEKTKNEPRTQELFRSATVLDSEEFQRRNEKRMREDGYADANTWAKEVFSFHDEVKRERWADMEIKANQQIEAVAKKALELAGQ